MHVTVRDFCGGSTTAVQTKQQQHPAAPVCITALPLLLLVLLWHGILLAVLFKQFNMLCVLLRPCSFFKRSGLPKEMLAKVWELANSQRAGALLLLLLLLLLRGSTGMQHCGALQLLVV
jgi:hypothetical protein